MKTDQLLGGHLLHLSVHLLLAASQPQQLLFGLRLLAQADEQVPASSDTALGVRPVGKKLNTDKFHIFQGPSLKIYITHPRPFHFSGKNNNWE